MNLDKIRTINELLTEQMNHWFLFPLALLVMGASRNLTGEGEPGVFSWALCSLFPMVFYLLRCKMKRLIPLVLAHLLAASLAVLIPTHIPAARTGYVLCVLGYMIYSLTLRLKHTEIYSGPVHLPVGVGIGVVSILFVHYIEISTWDHFYVLGLIAGIALSYITSYINLYTDFLILNKSSAGVLPAAEMFRSGMGLVLGYTLFGAVVLFVTSRFAWLAGILEPIKALLLRLLRFLLSGLSAGEEEKVLPIVEEMPPENMGEMALPEAGGTFWLWEVLEFVLTAAFVCGMIALAAFLILKLIQLILKYRRLRSRHWGMELGDAVDFREKCELEKNTRTKNGSILEALSGRERIRKLYKRKLLAAARSREEKGRLDMDTAREWEKRLNTIGMSALYEQARYSRQEMTRADVKRMKEICRR